MLGHLCVLIASAASAATPASAPGPERNATYREIAPLGVSFETFTALRLRADGHLLAADGPGKHIKIISPGGKEVDRIALPFRPEAFNDNAKQGKRFKAGDLITYVALRAAGDVTLEVDEVVIYSPR